MLDNSTSSSLELLLAGLMWILLGICLTRILNQSRSLSTNPVWAWVPIIQFWVLAQIGRRSFWSILWRSMLSSFLLLLVFSGIAIALENLFFLFIGYILAGVIGMYWMTFPAIRQGKFSNPHQLALMSGVPVINVFVFIHIAWKGQWS